MALPADDQRQALGVGLGGGVDGAMPKSRVEQQETEPQIPVEPVSEPRGMPADGSANWLLHKNEMLNNQVEDIRGWLLEAKLQNVRLKNELQSREGGTLDGTLSARDSGAPAAERAPSGCVAPAGDRPAADALHYVVSLGSFCLTAKALTACGLP